MATAKSLNIRQAAAVERMRQTLTLIETIIGVTPGDIDPRHKNEDIRQTLQLEAFADTLDAIAMAVNEVSQRMAASADALQAIKAELERQQAPPAEPAVETVTEPPVKAKRK